jgi:hypothetical protein
MFLTCGAVEQKDMVHCLLMAATTVVISYHSAVPPTGAVQSNYIGESGSASAD